MNKPPASSLQPQKPGNRPAVKADGSLVAHIKSLRFLKSCLLGILPSLVVLYTFNQEGPGWLTITVCLNMVLFPFARFGVDQIGLRIAPASFWRNFEDTNISFYPRLEGIYVILVWLLAIPAALALFIWLTVGHLLKRNRAQS